jgi:hypothetical protein
MIALGTRKQGYRAHTFFLEIIEHNLDARGCENERHTVEAERLRTLSGRT